ncbi:MAG: hypothetical protein JNG89_02855 [Planctomycetaceae bacterium]|nr:hypothetical protein [Planctomycetaceae bacterium]
MDWLFLGIVVAGGMYFLLSYRRFDVFSLAFFSGCVYFLPGFFGAVRDLTSDTPVPLVPEAYAVMAAVLAAIVVGGWSFTAAEPLEERRPQADGQTTYLALLAAILSLVIALCTDGDIYFSSDKGDVLGGMSRWFRLYCLASAMAAVLAFAHRQWRSLMVACGLLLFNVYIGFRATCAVTMLAIFLVHFHQQGPRRLVRDNRRAAVIAGAAAVFFFVYKTISKAIKLGEFEVVHERLVDPQFYLASVLDSEPFVTQSILNEVLRTGFETDGRYILTGIVAQFTFFGNELGIDVTSFNDLFQPVLFREVEFGLAGNVWAEMLAAGGWPLLCGFLAGFVLVLRALSGWLSASHVSTQACVALSAAYMAFYLHRTDVGFQITLQKRLLAVWFGVVLVSEVLRRLPGRKRTARLAGPRRRPHVLDRDVELESVPA